MTLSLFEYYEPAALSLPHEISWPKSKACSASYRSHLRYPSSGLSGTRGVGKAFQQS